jgi:hypothetical protein
MKLLGNIFWCPGYFPKSFATVEQLSQQRTSKFLGDCPFKKTGKNLTGAFSFQSFKEVG